MASDPKFDIDLNDEAGTSIGFARRREAIQRLQVGLAGLFIMVLLLSLASVVRDRATEVEQTTVSDNPEALTAEPPATSSRKDPLADAGVVPDLPAEPSQSSSQGRNSSTDANATPTQP